MSQADFLMGSDCYITAQVSGIRDGWNSSRQVPTFVIPAMHGLSTWSSVGELATEVMYPTGIPSEVTRIMITISAVPRSRDNGEVSRLGTYKWDRSE